VAVKHCERRGERGVEGKGGKGGGTALLVFLNMPLENEGTSRWFMTVVGLLAAVSGYQHVCNPSAPGNDTERTRTSSKGRLN